MGTIFSNCIENTDYSDKRNTNMATTGVEDRLHGVESTEDTPSVGNYDEIIKRARAMHFSLDWIQDEPHVSTMENEEKFKSITKTLVSKDYRGFVVGIHPRYGLLMLHCTRKKKKPPHYQLPGGHVDRDEFELYISGNEEDNKNLNCQASALQQTIYRAARAGCARELWEETGIDLRTSMDRLWPLVFELPEKESNRKRLINEFKDRLFFVVQLSDSDFFQNQDPTTKFTRAHAPIGSKDDSAPLFLKLSVEHSGFAFESQPQQAIELLELHSGGKVSKALGKACSLTSTALQDE